MVDVKGFNGGLNTDTADELLPSGDYKYAINIHNSGAGITPIPGNRELMGAPNNTRGGTEWVCGSFYDRKRQRVIYFTNHNLGAHRIISYELPSKYSTNGTYIVLFENEPNTFFPPLVTLQSTFSWIPYTKFNPNGLIKDIKVIHREYDGDLYYFIDPNKKLLKFNYDTLKRFYEGEEVCAFNWDENNYSGTTFRDGTAIPQITNDFAWWNATTPAWCWYNNDSSTDSVYGKLYNWYAVNDPRGFAPQGYKVPTEKDWNNLVGCLGGSGVAGGKLKSTDFSWGSPNVGATNESFMNVRGVGVRRGTDGGFGSNGDETFFWTSTSYSSSNSISVKINRYDTNVLVSPNWSNNYGFSVRLIKE